MAFFIMITMLISGWLSSNQALAKIRARGQYKSKIGMAPFDIEWEVLQNISSLDREGLIALENDLKLFLRDSPHLLTGYLGECHRWDKLENHCILVSKVEDYARGRLDKSTEEILGFHMCHLTTMVLNTKGYLSKVQAYAYICKIGLVPYEEADWLLIARQ